MARWSAVWLGSSAVRLGSSARWLGSSMVWLGSSALWLAGCSQEPSDQVSFEEAAGEWEFYTERRTTCDCAYDSGTRLFQLSCFPYEMDGRDENPFIYAPAQPNVREVVPVEVLVDDPDWSVPNLITATAEVHYTDEVILDPRGAPYETVYFPFFIHFMYLPEQEVCDYTNLERCRALRESWVIEGRMWCEDTLATYENWTGIE